MFKLCISLVFVTITSSVDVQYDEPQLHPLSDDYIQYINNVQSLWKAGRNFEPNTPIEHIQRLNGAIKSDVTLDIKKKEFGVINNQDLPESFDARKNWPNCPSLSEIRDQGNCGTCWAISATEVMTDRICIASNGTQQFHFSAFDLFTCCEHCSIGCWGGNASLGWKHWKEHGIVSGGNYDSKDKGCKPYPFPKCYLNLAHCDDIDISLNCKKQCVSRDLDYNNNKRFGKAVYSISSDEDEIKAEILNHGPVQATFKVFQDFFSYKSGVYRAMSKRSYGLHAVKILGWGVESGTKYWLIANSWNERWGDNGYFKIVRGENHCGIESAVLAGEPLL